MNIDQYPAASGRKIKENNQIVNTADMIEAIYNALVVNKNAGVTIAGADSAGGSMPTIITGNKISDVVTLQNAAPAIGVGNPIQTNGFGVAVLAISGNFIGTVTFEGQGPDGNWYAINALKRGSGLISSTTTTGGLFEVNTRGLIAVRANITSYTSGNITVKGQAQSLSTGGELIQIVNPDTSPVSSKITQSDAIVPMDQQSRLQTTIQTHNAVSVPASGTSLNSSWIDTDGYQEVGMTVTNDGATNNTGIVYWSNDGASTHGSEIPLAQGTPGPNNTRSTSVTTKARYMKIGLTNNDGAAAHTMSAWAYLKV